MPPEPPWTTEEAASYLHIHPQTLRKLIRQREDFPAYMVGGKYLIPRYGLEQWLARQAGAEYLLPEGAPPSQLFKH